jgi:ubiquinone/menaquinone biosynthesis C-methylase UbiE
VVDRHDLSASEALVAEGYDAVYEAAAHAPALWEIWREHVAGLDFPSAYSHISFVTSAELQHVAAALQPVGGGTLVDLACGIGGPSLWMRSLLEGDLIGIDASRVAVAAATARAVDLGVATRASFRVGTFARSGIPSGSADAIVSFDALQYAPDKVAACAEMARVLKRGKRLSFTAFEVIADRVSDLPVLGDDPVDDYAAVLDATGFVVDSYDETPHWGERLAGAYEAILANAMTLDREMGEAGYAALSAEVAVTLERSPYRRRVLAIAIRR